LATEAELASTRRIRQVGQIAEAISRSSAISWPQPPSAAGSAAVPAWPTLVKQPPADVHDPRPYCAR
jgi:hypothetical protein